MAHLFKLSFLLPGVLSAGLQAAPLNTEETPVVPRDYIAVYQVLRNNKNVAEVTISLTHQDKLWTLHGFTHDMRGLAKVLRIKGSQTAIGKWENGRFLPDEFKLSFSLLGYKTGWNAHYDWSSGIVTTNAKTGETQLPLEGSAFDPFSLSLNIRSLLAQNQTGMTVNVIDEDKIENHVYQAVPDGLFDSALGCLRTTRLSRIRENSKRTSEAWYANDHDYIPVQMQHSKKKGNKLELKIISLEVGGQKVEPTDPCAIDDRENIIAAR